LLGIYWIAQGLKGLKKKQSFRITSIQSLPKQIGTASPFRYEQGKVSQTQCSCGHQHLPNDQQLKQSGDLKYLEERLSITTTMEVAATATKPCMREESKLKRTLVLSWLLCVER
jgi:ABC-type nickel/cobalt efflux system permease component RcnA